jgi:copper resistance protein B
VKRVLLLAALFAASPAFAQTQGTDHSAHNMDEHADHGAAATPAGAGTEGETQRDAPPAVGTDQSPGSAEAPPMAHDRPADRYYDPKQMAEAEAALMSAHGAKTYGQIAFNLAEVQFKDGNESYRWDAEAWLGDLHRFVVKSEGEGTFREEVESAEVQALYSHALDPWWNLQLGLRQDFAPGPDRTYAVLGFEGRVPYQFHVTVAAFLSDKGQLRSRFDGTYDQRITQRLILQPRLELNFAAQDMPAQRLGAGLNDAELGLRLRYEIRREFAPYVGVSWTWLGGQTADYARADGRDTREGSIVLGVKLWF